MTPEQLVPQLKANEAFMRCVTAWHTLPAQSACFSPFPDSLHPKIIEALSKHGIHSLYTHQARAFSEIQSGHDVVVVTPTASGKTICYNLPVLNAIMENPDARALYLFPTKALSADQVSELYELIELMGEDIKTYTYDGDTPAAARRAVRQAGHVVVTNPDMLHSGILPHHTGWVKLFENLKYIVIDEIHTYRGIFGSNLANVLRRLLRLCEFYGSKPQFILCSATVKNPGELAQTLIGRPVCLIDENGAPRGERHFIFYNPPVVNRQLGIRRSALQETKKISSYLLKSGLQSIVFCKTRLQVEVLTRQLKEQVSDTLGNSGRVRGYRSGYLPTQRREIEQGLRQGNIDTVISTNALELGIDIGSLDACVMCGYPGTIASTLQQAGRAGRRQGTSLVILVATGNALDQFIVSHPEYFFAQSPENALLNPDNLYILLNHLKCAAYELPFKENEAFGNASGVQEMLGYLNEEEILHLSGGVYHWASEDFPASEIGLRSTMTENFTIMDITNPASPRMVGEMDRFTAPMLLHDNAIYMHEGTTYQVEKLDFDACKAFIRKVDSDYYTDADLNVNLGLLDLLEKRDSLWLCEVRVTALVRMFKKMRFDTGENVGYGPVMLPETEMHTNAVCYVLDDAIASQYTKDDLQGGMLGIANLLRIAAPLSLMCSLRDIAVIYQVKCPFTQSPTLILYDNCPGGVGLAEKACRMWDLLLADALHIAQGCSCEAGCPSCAGPVGEIGLTGKQAAIGLLKKMLQKR